MSRKTASALDQGSIDAFLQDQSAGTLSLAKSDESYAIPLAYTFDEKNRDIYFRLGYTPGSRKREYIDSTDRATFVVTAETESGWKSVVARGELSHQSTVENLDRHRSEGDAVSQAERELRIPFYHVFEEPTDNVYALVQLRTDELTGVVEADGSS